MLIIFFEKYTPLPRGYGGIFSEQQSSPPVNLEESRSLKKFSKKFMYKTIPSNLLWTRFSYFCLFFLFKYDEIIIKQPSSHTFSIKVVKF